MHDGSAKFTSVLANQHLRFIPKKKLKFDHLSGDGPLSLVYEASKDQQKTNKYRPQTGRVYLAATLPALYMATVSLPLDQLMFVYPAMIIPAIYSIYDSFKAKK